MTEAGSPDPRGDDGQITDDDELAEAILASFTSSIPVLRPSRSLPSEADLIALVTGPIALSPAALADGTPSASLEALPNVAAGPAAAAEPGWSGSATPFDPTIPWSRPTAVVSARVAESDSPERGPSDPDVAGADPRAVALTPGVALAEPLPASVESSELGAHGDRDGAVTTGLDGSLGPAVAVGGAERSRADARESGPEVQPRGAHRASTPIDWTEAPAPTFAAPSLIEPPEHVAVVPPMTAPNEIPPQASPVPVSESVGFAQLESTEFDLTPEATVLSEEDALALAGDSGFAPPPASRKGARLRRGALVGLERVGVEPTPQDGRDGRSLRLFWLWFAANAGVLSLGVGGVLVGEGLSLRQSIVAALAGVLLSCLPLAIGSLAGKWSGQPALVVSRASFGHFGNILPALVALLSRVIWAGLLVWVAADGIRAGFASLGIRSELVLPISYGVCVVFASGVAIVGYGLITRLQGLLSGLSILIVVALIAASAGRVDLTAALKRPDASWVLVVGGAVLVFSFVGLAWVHSSADVARYQRRSGSNAAVAVWSSLGAALPVLALVGWGAVLAASSPGLAARLEVSPVAAVVSVVPGTFVAPLLVLVAVSSLAGSVMSVYSSGFSLLAAGVKSSRPAATVLAGGLAAVAAAVFCFDGTTNWALVRDLLVLLAVPIAAWTGVFLADLGARRGAYDAASLLHRGGAYGDVRPVGFLGFIVACGIGYGFVTAAAAPLGWAGFGWRLLGLESGSVLWSTQLGVLLALLIGLLFSIVSSLLPGRRRGVEFREMSPTGTLRLADAVPS